MKRIATNWQEEFERIKNVERELASRINEEVMSLVPGEVWTIIVELLSEKKSKHIFRVLTRVSKQLYVVLHQISPKIPIELDIVNQYPNTKILKLPFHDGCPIIPPLKKLECLIIHPTKEEIHDVYKMNLRCLKNENFPNLSSITFDSIDSSSRNRIVIPQEMRKNIRELRLEKCCVLGKCDMKHFPNLVRLSCSVISTKAAELSDFSGLTHLKLSTMTKEPLETFTGELTYGHIKIKYQIEKGLLNKIPATEEYLYYL